MNFDKVNVTECYFCLADDSLTPYLIEWSVSRPDILSFCGKEKCRSWFTKIYIGVGIDATVLTLEEAKVLIVKSRL